MPVQEGYDTKGCYWQYGKTGKKYRFKCGDKAASYAAMQKALEQATAIEHNTTKPTPQGAPGSNYGPRVIDIIPGEQAPKIAKPESARIPKAELKVLVKEAVKTLTPTNDEVTVVEPSFTLYNSLLSLFKGLGFGSKSDSSAYIIGSQIETKRQEQEDTRGKDVAVTASELGNAIGVGPNVTFNETNTTELVRVSPADAPKPTVGPLLDDELFPEEKAVQEYKAPAQDPDVEDYLEVGMNLLQSVWDIVKLAGYTKDAAIAIAGKIQELRGTNKDTAITPGEKEKLLEIEAPPEEWIEDLDAYQRKHFPTDAYKDIPVHSSLVNRINNAISEKPAPDFLLQNTTQRIVAAPETRPQKETTNALPLAMPLAKMPLTYMLPSKDTTPAVQTPYELGPQAYENYRNTLPWSDYLFARPYQGVSVPEYEYSTGKITEPKFQSKTY